MDEHNETKSLAQVREDHRKYHCGFVWDCRRLVKGKECRHHYQDALIRESDREIEAQRQSAAEVKG